MDTVRRFCTHVVRFVSTIAMDPHLYFEQSWNAEIAAIQSREDLLRRMDQLVTWVDAIGLSNNQRRRLDAALIADGLPAFSWMRDGRGRAAAKE